LHHAVHHATLPESGPKPLPSETVRIMRSQDVAIMRLGFRV
jgi:hypothetical protein